MGAQIEFFQPQSLHFAFWMNIFGQENILIIFRQPKIYRGHLLSFHHLPPCHDATASESNQIGILPNRIGFVVSRIAHL